MDKHFEINKNHLNIKCKLYFDQRYSIEQVVLFGHGFAGHKDNGSAQKFADRVLSKYKGVAVLVFNLPCHGNDVKKKIVLQDCLDYIHTVINYINEQWNTPGLYSYATSFGGYLILKYITEYGNPFKKIVLRCPAVNMANILTTTIMKNDELKKVLKGKTVSVGFDRKVEVTRQFLTDLEESDIQRVDYREYADDILILHGTKDEVVPFEAVQRFAENNRIAFIPVENADHRFQNPTYLEIATKKVLEFFEL